MQFEILAALVNFDSVPHSYKRTDDIMSQHEQLFTRDPQVVNYNEVLDL